MRMIFEPLFEAGVVKIRQTRAIEVGSYVVSEEFVDYGGHETHYVGIYEIRDGLIQAVRFLREILASS